MLVRMRNSRTPKTIIGADLSKLPSTMSNRNCMDGVESIRALFPL